jgi:hypothetical protein
VKPNNILESLMLSDTWEWDGANWTQVADIGPSQRFFHGMAYDHVRQTLILFGGRDSETRNDTWEWDGEFWTQLDDSGPPPRTQFGMAGDSRRQRIVIFGGEGRGGQLADTWEWDGNEWTQQEDQGPIARSGQAMAFDIQNGNTVLHGGVETINHQVTDGNDTWVWNGSVWTQVSDMGPALTTMLWLQPVKVYCSAEAISPGRGLGMVNIGLNVKTLDRVPAI